MPKRSVTESTDTNEKSEELLAAVSKEKDDLSDSDESVYSDLEEEEEGSASEDEELSDNDKAADEGSEGDDEGEEDDDDAKEEVEGEEDENEGPSIEGLESEDEDEEPADEELKMTQTISSRKEEVVSIKAGMPKYQATFEEVDTSDEEDIRNTVGNIPMEWYNDYPHIGYSLNGKRILKPAQGDQLDTFLSRMDDPEQWRTVYDKLNMKSMKLSDDEVDIIQRIQGGTFPESQMDPYAPYVDWFTGDKMEQPIKDNPESKNSFIPSKWEHKRVMRIVRAIRNGWIKPKKSGDDKPQFYLLWSNEDRSKEHPMHWPAPKLKLPGHEESYNPPREYLPTEEERSAWEAQDAEDRSQNFLPQRYDALRKVPGYSNFVQEKFERCLDLYLCPRQRKIRLQIDPEDLIPKLPRPRDLQPFPSVESIIYRGHSGCVTGISVDPSGQWMASGADDSHVHLWEVSTGRCMRKINVGGTVHSIAWNPSSLLPIVAVAVQNTLLVINPLLGDKILSSNIDNKIKGFMAEADSESQENLKWMKPSEDELEVGIRLKVAHEKDIKQVIWHSKGDYLATVSPNGSNKSVYIHQLSKQKSQCPFKKSKGIVQCACFHPTRPFFFVATQRNIRVYNLQKQELIKKLQSGVKWISSLAVHPQGDNLIIGSYDKRMCWFDMDLSSKPYKTLRHHKRAVRQVAYHRSYPLFASASDDGTVIVCHGMVYSDLMQNPLIVPLKIIRGHKITNDLGITDCQFHPHQPWLFTAGADHTIRLFT